MIDFLAESVQCAARDHITKAEEVMTTASRGTLPVNIVFRVLPAISSVFWKASSEPSA